MAGESVPVFGLLRVRTRKTKTGGHDDSYPLAEADRGVRGQCPASMQISITIPHAGAAIVRSHRSSSCFDQVSFIGFPPL